MRPVCKHSHVTKFHFKSTPHALFRSDCWHINVRWLDTCARTRFLWSSCIRCVAVFHSTVGICSLASWSLLVTLFVSPCVSFSSIFPKNHPQPNTFNRFSLSIKIMSLTSIPIQPTLIGGLPPPPGVVPNFVDPFSIANTLRGVGVFCVVLTTFTTAIRLYTKFYIIKVHGWEDCTWHSIFSCFDYLETSLTGEQILCSLHRYELSLLGTFH